MTASEFKATVEALADIRQWLDAQLQAELTENQADTLRTPIITTATEWVTNVLRHASIPASGIRVEFRRNDVSVNICISDDSDSSDPFHNPEISPLADIPLLATNGRGLAMIIAMTDAVEYQPRCSKHDSNTLSLTFGLT